MLRRQGLIPGIKVDGGTKPLAGFPDEVVTEGLDGLRGRLEDYAALGARFAKWRAVIRIGETRPTATCIEANAHALARYAALAQEAGLTPIVEPEVLMDGTHDLERCAEVTRRTLRVVYEQLSRHRIVLEASLLKPNMILPGNECPSRRATTRSPSRRSGSCVRRCPRRCPDSSSCPVAKPTSRPPPAWMH